MQLHSETEIREKAKYWHPLLGGLLLSDDSNLKPDLDKGNETGTKKEKGKRLAEQFRKVLLRALDVKDVSQLEGPEFLDKIRSNYFRVVGKTRRKMIDLFYPLIDNKKTKKEDSESKEIEFEKAMRRASEKANDLIKFVLKEFMQDNSESFLGVTNEVENCKDPAELLVMAADPELEPKIRFEAQRKLYLMYLFLKIDLFKELQTNDLSFFNTLLRRIEAPIKGRKKGARLRRYLVSEHDSRSGKTVGVKMFDQKSEAIAYRSNTIEGGIKREIATMELRSFKSTSPEGERRIHHYMIDTREKTDNSIELKLFRDNAAFPSNFGLKYGEKRKRFQKLLKDLNGIQPVFFSEQEMELFFDELKKAIVEPDEEDNKKYSFSLTKVKNGLGKGQGLKCNKYELTIDGSVFEVQAFALEEYADYKHRLPWDRYELNRFFEHGVAQALFPFKIYGGIDLEKSHKKAIEVADVRANRKGDNS